MMAARIKQFEQELRLAARHSARDGNETATTNWRSVAAKALLLIASDNLSQNWGLNLLNGAVRMSADTSGTAGDSSGNPTHCCSKSEVCRAGALP